MLDALDLVVSFSLVAGGSASGTVDVAVDPDGPVKFKQVFAMVLEGRAEMQGPPWNYTWTCTDKISKCIVLTPKQQVAP